MPTQHELAAQQAAHAQMMAQNAAMMPPGVNQAGLGGLGGGIGSLGPVLPSQPVPSLHERARELFLKRMGGVRSQMKLGTEDFIHCQVYKDEVLMFYLLNGKEGIVREPVDFFPSDTLITQFRMILS